jgi:hypothetical protein
MKTMVGQVTVDLSGHFLSYFHNWITWMDGASAEDIALPEVKIISGKTILRTTMGSA